MLSDKEIQALLKENDTGPKGLSTGQVQTRKSQYGPNQITGKKKTPLFIVFLGEFKDLMVIILLVAAALAYAAGEVTDASVIFFIVVLNATIGFIQKFKAEKAIEALQKLVAPQARVLRNGKESVIDAKELVPGDIIILEEGDQVPADAILYEVNELSTQESALTGESLPVQKLTHDLEETQNSQAEKENMVFMGTSVAHGSAKAVVVHTGMNTQMGKIAKLTSETKKDLSPLEKELTRIGVFVGKIALVISAILLAVGVFIQKEEFVDTLLFAVSVAVAAVPEGLPATITIALAIGVQKLAKNNAIMKQLSSVETLGSTTVICSDKTGTLTKNEMTVKEIWFDGHAASVHGVGYKPAGYINIQKKNKSVITIGKSSSPYEDYELTKKDLTQIAQKEKGLYLSLELFMKTAFLCNNAKLTKQGKHWKVLGDPTEGALLTLVQKCGFNPEQMTKDNTRIHDISFDSVRKRMTTIIKTSKGDYLALTKGAPDSIIACCTREFTDGKENTFTKKEKDQFIKKNEQMARKALRVLGFAYRKLSPQEVKKYQKSGKFPHKEIEKDLTFLGLSGMIDPPRAEVKESVQLAKKANIRVYIITGDHGLTAQAIARQLGIISSKRDHKIITGQQLQKLKDPQLKKLMQNKKLDVIFARVSPEHKLRIVTALKAHGEVVAVTGDGVNDAPALKKADIGVAMGISGTDVSKEASNMILADDSFSTIVTAIKEGRTIYDNLKKFVFYVFSCNIGELVTIFMAIILSLPAPLSAILILCIDLGTDVLPAVALGIDPSEPGIMEKKPRNPKEKIMNGPFIQRYLYLGIFIGLVVMAVYIWSLYYYGWTWGEPLADENFIHLKASSTAFATLIIIQMFNAFNSRSEKYSVFQLGLFSNKWLLGAIAISLMITFIFVEVPAVQELIGTTALSLMDWAVVLGASFTVLIMEELRKFFVRRKAA